MIKRRDGFDGFKVTPHTGLCEEHFKASDIKKNPLHWKLVADAAPSLKLYVNLLTTTQIKRKLHKDRSGSVYIIRAEPDSEFRFGGYLPFEAVEKYLRY